MKNYLALLLFILPVSLVAQELESVPTSNLFENQSTDLSSDTPTSPEKALGEDSETQEENSSESPEEVIPNSESPELLNEKIQETEVIYQNQPDKEITGVSICLNKVLDKKLLAEDWQTQQKIQVGSGPKIDFTGMPKIIAKDLDPKKRVRIKITYGSELVTAWWQSFQVGVSMIKVQFKPGTWQAKPYGPGAKCDGEMP